MSRKNRLSLFFEEIGDISLFSWRFIRHGLKPPYEFQEFIWQCYKIGYQSLPLVAITGFIMGLVLTLQTRPTLIEFGAESWMPSMVGIAIVREIGPVITALICAGRVGSSIGAELGSMKVTQQIDAMEVAGTNPFKYLVSTRVLAATLMLPVLVILADIISMLGSYLVENIKGDVSLQLYFRQVFEYLHFSDVFPSIIKSFFFGFVIGIVGCYKGYYSKKGTEGVGHAANTAVVMSSMLIFVVDFIVVLIADLFYEL